jgi:hypothetical protein
LISIDVSEVDGDAHLAWPDQHALEALEALRNTKIAVSAVNVYAIEGLGPLPTADAWTCTPIPGETSTEFAIRSRERATEYIEQHETTDRALYLLELTGQEDAA